MRNTLNSQFWSLDECNRSLYLLEELKEKVNVLQLGTKIFHISRFFLLNVFFNHYNHRELNDNPRMNQKGSERRNKCKVAMVYA